MKDQIATIEITKNLIYFYFEDFFQIWKNLNNACKMQIS